MGSVPTPVRLTIIYENGIDGDYYKSADIWKEGNDIYSIEITLSGILKEIQLGENTIPDSNRENNFYLVH